MASIAEMTGIVANHWPVELGQSDVHPFWGDPPDLATCDEWMQKVLATHENIQRDLSFASTGGRILGENGKPLRHEEFSAWRSEKIHKAQKTMRRYRWLKGWRARAAADGRQATEQAKMSVSQGAAVANGRAIKAAMKRYGILENLYDAATAYVAEDTDESWERFLAELERAHEVTEL